MHYFSRSHIIHRLSRYGYFVSIHMMRRFELVSRNCVHKVTLEWFKHTRRSRVCFRPLQRYRVHTVPSTNKIKPLNHLFYRMGEEKKRKKKVKICYFPNHASSKNNCTAISQSDPFYNSFYFKVPCHE